VLVGDARRAVTAAARLAALPSARAREESSSVAKPLKRYAPFCKHLFIPNFLPGLKAPTVPITPANEAALRSAYDARTEDELPVLVRWLDAAVLPLEGLDDASHLDVILYSREQIRKENADMGKPSNDETAPWGASHRHCQRRPPATTRRTTRRTAEAPSCAGKRALAL